VGVNWSQMREEKNLTAKSTKKAKKRMDHIEHKGERTHGDSKY
jgi:hypothetical protein